MYLCIYILLFLVVVIIVLLLAKPTMCACWWYTTSFVSILHYYSSQRVIPSAKKRRSTRARLPIPHAHPLKCGKPLRETWFRCAFQQFLLLSLQLLRRVV
jgi:hypothetical protein